ncbi:uncharacterized protein LOC132274143 [Cornus florida]|uniref:uncharacterized protein LOC132274143 n=1 Tax=Cornus florida TaxID=4283 RepID=UPI00289E71B2|nr:uncharacterized protein LOC132274143 [Cornus florida]
MENTAPKNHPMGWSKFVCKRHTNHDQSPGVCSVCLREKLCQLSTTSSMASSCSSKSSSSSRYSSFGTSPASHRHRSEAKGSISFLKSGKDVLSKSRSTVFVPRIGREAVDGKKKRGFWSKLLRRRSKRKDEGLVQHSVITREMMSTRF